MKHFATRIATVVRTFMTFLACTVGSNVSAQTAAQPVAPDTLFGIRIGQVLESQMGECPKDEKGEYKPGYQSGDKACWVQSRYGKEVRLPLKVVADTRIGFDSDPRVRTRDGVVVEIDAYAEGRQWREVERYLIKLFGKPHESETYERDSRVFGISKVQARTWRGNGVTLYFDARASNEQARIRAFSDAWAKIDAAEQEDLRNRSIGK
jgi:hypothetical protein